MKIQEIDQKDLHNPLSLYCNLQIGKVSLEIDTDENSGTIVDFLEEKSYS